MAEHAGVVRITTLVPAEGRRQELIDACRQFENRARDADGCFGAQVCEVAEDPDTVAVLSRWRDRDSLDTFVTASTAELQDLTPLLSGLPSTRHYSSVS